jgi:hypothetical protein
MEASKYQSNNNFTENQKLKASRPYNSNHGFNIRPSWWISIPDTNIATVSSEITNSLQTESTIGIECRDQCEYIPEESTSATENEDSFCTDHLKQETEDSVDGEAGVNKEVVTHDTKWEIMFDRLVEFKKKYGHCLVPNRYKNDNKLGSWVSTQRKQYKALACGRYDATTLPTHRIKKLDEIGFVWSTSDPRRVDWEVRYSQLKDFFRKYGM